MLGGVTVGHCGESLGAELGIARSSQRALWLAGTPRARSQLGASPSVNMKSGMLAGRQHCKSQQAVQMEPWFLFAESPKPRTVDTLRAVAAL